MTELLFIVLVAVTGVVLVIGISRRGGFLEYPFLAAAVYAAWFLPQVYALLGITDISSDGLPLVLIMANLCLLAIVAGWAWGSRRSARVPRAPVPIERLFWPVAILTGFGLLVEVIIRLQPDEMRASSQWTGPLTILAFFKTTLIIPFAYSMLMVVRRREPRSLILFGANLLIFAPTAIILFRRTETIGAALAFAFALWALRRYAPPRWMVVSGIVLAVLLTYSIGQLRALGGGYTLNEQGELETRIPTLSEIMDIDLSQSSPLDAGNIEFLEVRNAAVSIGATDYLGEYSLGSDTWNRLVGAMVPGQLIGFETKRSMMIGVSASELARREMNYNTRTGTTNTGFTDAYHDFWYFGAFIFGFTGLILGFAFRRGLMGDTHFQVVYMATVVLGLNAITHFSTYWFIQSPIILAGILFVRLVAGASPKLHPADLRQRQDQVRYPTFSRPDRVSAQ